MAEAPEQRADAAAARRRVLGLVAVVFAVCAFRIFALVAEHGVNLMVMDQFDFFVPLFDAGYGPIDKFRFQFVMSAHRMGAGWPVIEIAARLSDWNTRADGYAIGLVMCVAAGLALLLKRRLTGKLEAADACIPLLILSLRQWTTFIGTTDASVGAVPVLLLVALGLALTIEAPLRRLGAVLFLDLLCIYTGFAFFAGLFVPLLVLREGYVGVLSWRTALLGCLVSIGLGLSFFVGFDMRPATEPVATDLGFGDYLTYATNLFVSFFAVRSGWLANFLAILWPLMLGAPLLVAGHRLLQRGDETAAAVVTLLCGFGLAFVVANTLGRVGESAEFAFTPRYITLMLPGMLGLYLGLQTLLEGRSRRIAAAVFGVAMLAGEVGAASADLESAKALAQARRAWKGCYFATHDLARCNATTGTMVYPWEKDYPRIEQRLRQLEERQLNLFAPAKDAAARAQ